jgi:hypothetical protein
MSLKISIESVRSNFFPQSEENKNFYPSQDSKTNEIFLTHSLDIIKTSEKFSESLGKSGESLMSSANSLLSFSEEDELSDGYEPLGDEEEDSSIESASIDPPIVDGNEKSNAQIRGSDKYKMLFAFLTEEEFCQSKKKLSTLAIEILKRVQPEKTAFCKYTRKDTHAYIGFAIHGSQVYLHEKTFIGAGHSKETYEASLLNLEACTLEEIVYQKRKKNALEVSPIGRVKQEVILQSLLDHPNIVKIYGYDFNDPQSKFSIYAEKCDMTLEEMIEKNSLNFSEKVGYAENFASALAHVHDNGLVHNDIKPDNLLSKGRMGKVTDFGLCLPIGSQYAGFRKIYAPEQKSDPIIIGTTQTDVYQFGLTLWHLFHPNPPSTHLKIDFVYPEFQNLFNEWTKPNSNLQNVQSLISECLNPNPALRPSMKDVQQKLQQLLN